MKLSGRPRMVELLSTHGPLPMGRRIVRCLVVAGVGCALCAPASKAGPPTLYPPAGGGKTDVVLTNRSLHGGPPVPVFDIKPTPWKHYRHQGRIAVECTREFKDPDQLSISLFSPDVQLGSTVPRTTFAYDTGDDWCRIVVRYGRDHVVREIGRIATSDRGRATLAYRDAAGLLDASVAAALNGQGAHARDLDLFDTTGLLQHPRILTHRMTIQDLPTPDSPVGPHTIGVWTDGTRSYAALILPGTRQRLYLDDTGTTTTSNVFQALQSVASTSRWPGACDCADRFSGHPRLPN